MDTVRRSPRLATATPKKTKEMETLGKVATPRSTATKKPNGSKGGKELCLMDKFEAVCWFLTLAIYFNFYNPVGELTARRNVDYTWLLITELDKQLPTVSSLAVPYVICFFTPIVLFWYQFFTNKLDLGHIRRAYLGQILMITFGSCIFYWFPVSIKAISIKEMPKNPSVFDVVNFRVVHTGMSLFCSFPSMHIGHAWYQFFYMREMKSSGWKAMCVLAWLQFPATVLTRAHILMDLPAGFLLAYVFGQWFYVPMERAKIFEPAKTRPFSVPRAGVIALAPIITLSVYQYILAETGWGGLSELFSHIPELFS